MIRLAGYGLNEKGDDIITIEKMKAERLNSKKRERMKAKREAKQKAKDNGTEYKEDDEEEEEDTKETKKNNKDKEKKNTNVSSVIQGEDSIEARQTKKTQNESTTKTRHLAGQALARILISINPEM